MRATLLVALWIVTGVVSSGCATVVHGGNQQLVGIASNPSGAQVTVDDQDRGTTPLSLKLERDKPHTIVVKKTGYEDGSAATVPTISGWIWGNILLGGLIGLAVDFISGSAYNVSPETLSVSLTRTVAPVAQAAPVVSKTARASPGSGQRSEAVASTIVSRCEEDITWFHQNGLFTEEEYARELARCKP